MLIFRNPGLIDLEAVRTLGVSVKRAGSFGRFGTGLKFAIASILRDGGTITIYRGLEAHALATDEREVRGTKFQFVTLDGDSMGITTALGRDWEPWMVLRELGCNALDEGGEFGPNVAAEPTEDVTTILVEWDGLETAYRQRKDLFLEGAPLWESPAIRILPGPSAHIFYRGIRVLKLNKPSLFTFDVLTEQVLTEDRTLAGSWAVDTIIRDAFLTAPEKSLVAQALTAGENYHEGKLDYEDVWGVKPSKAFLGAAVEARESKTLKSESARKVLLRHMRTATEEASTHGHYRRVVDDAFTYAREQLDSLGIEFTDEQPFVIIDEMPGPDTLSMVEEGRIYILQDLMKRSAREIMAELLYRWVDLNVVGYGMEDAVRLLAPFIIGKSKDLKDDEALVREDETIEAEEILGRPDLDAEP